MTTFVRLSPNYFSEVDLRLFARRRLESNLEPGHPQGPKFTQQISDRRVSALISALFELTPQSTTCQGRESREPLAQIRFEWVDQTSPGRSCLVARRRQALSDMYAHGFAVDAELASDGGH